MLPTLLQCVSYRNEQTEPYVGKQERATNCYEKKKVDISSTSFNKFINLCVNCNCVATRILNEHLLYETGLKEFEMQIM
jgi:predicted nucleotidyltransferase